MEMDLTKFDSVVHREMSASHNAKQVKCVKINKKNLILKKFSSYDKYLHEKKIYNILEDEDFVPKLVYFDNKNWILALTDVGDSLEIYKLKNKKKYEKFVENINTQIKDVEDKLITKYSLYHNDLLAKNICIDDNNYIRIIDLETVDFKPAPRWHRWGTPRPPPLSQEEAERDKRKKEKKEKKRNRK